MTADLGQITRTGVLRVAINTGNRALVQHSANSLNGVSPALARRLAAALGVEMVPVVYDGAGQVFADAGRDKWDVGFLAIDAMRAQKLSYTRPYLTIEATFAVRAPSDIADVCDVDRPGRRVLTARGSAYDMYLTDNLVHACLDRHGTPPESFTAFRTGQWDAVAGVRASLVRAFGDDPAMRILPGILSTVDQAMVLPGPAHPAIGALDEFVAAALADGFVAAAA